MVLLTATVVAPLLFFPGVFFPYVTTRALLFRAAVEGALLLFLWLLLTRGVSPGSDGERHDLRDPVLWALAGFTAWAAISAPFGAAPETSLFGDLERMWGVVQWVHLLLFYILLRSLFQEEDWRRFFRASLVVAVVVCGYGLLRWYGATETLGAFGAARSNPIGTLGNRGYLSIYALVHASLAGVLWAREPSPGWRRALYAAAGGLAALTFLVAASRAALMGAFAGGSVLVVARGGQIRNCLLALRPLQVAAGAVAAGLLVWGGWHLLTEIEPFTRRLANLELGARRLPWRAAAAGFLENPLTGFGLENFTVVFERYASAESGPSALAFRDRAHNAYLGAAAATGLPGLLLYLGVGAGVGWTLWRGWRARRIEGPEASALTVLFVAYAVFLLFWFEDHNTAFLVLAAAAYLRYRTTGRPLLAPAGGSGSPAAGRDGRSFPSVWPRWAGALLLALAGAVALQHHGRVWLAARETHLALEARNLPEKVERLERARSLGIPQDREIAYAYVDEMARYRGAAEWVRAREERVRALERGIAGAGEAISAAVAERPGEAGLWKQHGLLALTAHRLTGRRELYERAVRSLEAAVERSPGRPQYLHLLADARLAEGDVDGARRTVEEALALNDRLPETYYVLSRVHDRAGEPATAARELYRACRMDYRWQDTPHLALLARRLADDGRPDQAAELYRECFAAKYLPALRSRTFSLQAVPGGEPIFLPAGAIPRGLLPSADDPCLVTGIRTYAIEPEDLAYLLPWPLLYLRAGAPEEATLAARLVMNGLRPENETFVLFPYLTRFVRDVQAGRLERWEGRESLLPEGARLEVIRGRPGEKLRESSKP